MKLISIVTSTYCGDGYGHSRPSYPLVSALEGTRTAVFFGKNPNAGELLIRLGFPVFQLDRPLKIAALAPSFPRFLFLPFLFFFFCFILPHFHS